MIHQITALSLLVATAPTTVTPVQGAPIQSTTSAAPAAFDASVARRVVATLADTLSANFVLPDEAERYAAMLRAKVAAGDYNQFADAAAFAKQVTADLQTIYPDRHLRLFAPGSAGPRGPKGAPAKPIARSGWIAPGVAYIDFEIFDGSSETLAKLATFMAKHASARTFIVDARHHHGGGLDEMDVMFPYLFAAKTKLLTLDTREAVVKAKGDPFGDIASVLPEADAPAGVVRRSHYALPGKRTAMREAEVYVLTSGQTASSAEHMSLALKRTHRATLIGETTAGAGNYGDFLPLGDGYRAFVPMGRTFDPDTGKGWEGTGVTPDIAVPADTALDVALRKAGVKARCGVGPKRHEQPPSSGPDC